MPSHASHGAPPTDTRCNRLAANPNPLAPVWLETCPSFRHSSPYGPMRVPSLTPKRPSPRRPHDRLPCPVPPHTSRALASSHARRTVRRERVSCFSEDNQIRVQLPRAQGELERGEGGERASRKPCAQRSTMTRGMQHILLDRFSSDIARCDEALTCMSLEFFTLG